MNPNYFRLLLLVSILSYTGFTYSQTLKYTTPVNKSSYNMENTNIILDFNSNQNNQQYVKLKVKGSVSGYHNGKSKIINSNPLKISFTPDYPFTLGEKVTVTGYNHSDKFVFYIRNQEAGNLKNFISENLSEETNSLKPVYNQYPVNYSPLLDTLPVLTINQYGPTAPGNILIINFLNFFNPSFLMVLENDGTPKFSRRLKYRGYDFKKVNNHYIYWDEEFYNYRELDSTYNVVDSFYCGNGYGTNFHDCALNPDNSAWLLSYDPQVVDMSRIYPGGKTNATVTGLIIQKINSNKDVVFQWRSWDHMSILDATHESFTAQQIDYVHGNSITVDYDGNIILSSRHLDEISKINSVSGEFIWRLGGKNNQFTFLNDTAKFSHQHYIRRLADNHILFFDNGNFHIPKYSRAVEYNINEASKTVEMVWEYRNTPSIYSAAMGSAQRLANGNTLIGWGQYSTTLTEVDSNKSVLYTLALPPGQFSYRAVRYNTTDVTTNTISDNSIVSDYKLSQNFPNPFNPTTKINFSLPKSGFVTLKVYNLIGQEVALLVNEEKNIGNYSVDFNATGLTSGIYFYKINVNEFNEVRKMMLIK